MPDLFAMALGLGMLGIWYAWYQFSIRKFGSRSIASGGGFLIAALASIPLIMLLSSIWPNDEPQKQATPSRAPAAAITAPPPRFVPDHNYAMQDGMKYGYPAAISEEGKRAGQKAEQVVMAMYAGEKHGKYQVHLIDGVSVTAMECESPCRFIKMLGYVDNPYLKDQIKVEHIAAAPDSLAYLMMEDAIRGKMKQYGVGSEKKRFTVWVDEHKGMQRTPMAK